MSNFNLGSFHTDIEAHFKWKQRRDELANELITMYPNMDNRVIGKLKTMYKD